ncbi:ABC transporter substrate-binding lipoprotein [Oscillibacter valericigenes Sjm18-20]|nr:ABC transporter substrate-binding lipoprotein [Oscillibacter valericigenes Sjm18-20]
MKKLIASLLAGILMLGGLTGCSGTSAVSSANTSAASAASQEGSENISIVCTNFPEYDFARQIAGDCADITMLLKPGAESHSFEPTPQDIITIQNSDLFIYVGGDSDEWVANILDSMDRGTMTVFKLMDCVNLVEEELSEGMQAEAEEADEGEEEGPEMDEHVWTSPANAMQIVQDLSDTLCKIDPGNQETYQANTKAYLVELQSLDDAFREVISSAARKEIIVGDRFPFRYFCEEFGLTYYAAFPGCSTDTEADPATVAFLIDQVKEDKIPVVFHIELSNEEMCDSICEATGARSQLLNAVHNVSDEDFKNGVTYIDLMNHNVDVLREALN